MERNFLDKGLEALYHEKITPLENAVLESMALNCPGDREHYSLSNQVDGDLAYSKHSGYDR